jgi:hypothetical protein
MVSFESTDPVEQFLIEVHNLRTSDGQICNYRMGVDLQDEIRIARILVAKIAAMERDGCLKACEQIAAKCHMKMYATDWPAQECIAAIKARGES